MLVRLSRLFLITSSICLLLLSGCAREIKVEENQPSVSYGQPMGVSEVEINGVKITPEAHIKTMPDMQFLTLSESELHAYKLTLTQEQLEALPADRREAIENARSTAQPPEDAVAIYRDGKRVELAEALKDYSVEDLQTLFTPEERQLVLQYLTDEQVSQLTAEQQSALKAQ
jgi:hypothetical protein